VGRSSLRFVVDMIKTLKVSNLACDESKKCEGGWKKVEIVVNVTSACLRSQTMHVMGT
jgi:hypothetical protein